jgi:hypothetical protein
MAADARLALRSALAPRPVANCDEPFPSDDFLALAPAIYGSEQ